MHSDRSAGSLRTSALVVIGAMVLVGCGSGGSDSGADSWTDEDATWMQPPGTSLGADLEVPEEAQLVGPVFASIDERSPIEGGEWFVDSQVAHLVSASDIEDLAADLVRQLGGAEAVDPLDGPGLCQQAVRRGSSSLDVRPYRGDLDPDAVRLSCSGVLANGLSEPGLGVTFELRQEVGEPNQPVQGVVGWGESSVLVPNTLPETPDDVGGPRSVPNDVEAEPDLTVVDGSFLAGPPGWGSITGGYTAVIGVTGDPDEVFDAYLDQFGQKPFYKIDARVDDLRVRQEVAGGSGGITFSVKLNELGGNAWILVEAWND